MPLRSTTLDLYLDEIARTKPLSIQQEYTLWQRIQTGDHQARNTLIQANLRFVVSVAIAFKRNSPLPLEDLVSAGNMGLVTAAQRFDGRKGVKFITYAIWWVKRYMQYLVAENKSLVRLPDSKIQRKFAIDSATQKLVQAQERAPRAEAVAERLGLATAQVRDTQLDDLCFLSLQAPVEDSDDTTLEEVLAEPNQILPDEDTLKNATHTLIRCGIDQLQQRERYIIKRYFGLDGGADQTMNQIGKSLGLTRERVRQLIDTALHKLKTWLLSQSEEKPIAFKRVTF